MPWVDAHLGLEDFPPPIRAEFAHGLDVKPHMDGTAGGNVPGSQGEQSGCRMQTPTIGGMLRPGELFFKCTKAPAIWMSPLK